MLPPAMRWSALNSRVTRRVRGTRNARLLFVFCAGTNQMPFSKLMCSHFASASSRRLTAVSRRMVSTRASHSVLQTANRFRKKLEISSSESARSLEYSVPPG